MKTFSVAFEPRLSEEHVARITTAIKKFTDSTGLSKRKPIIVEPTARQKKAEAAWVMKQHAAYWDWVYSNEDDAEEGTSE